ncbi:hypothetical protein V6R21_07575 [Limibacter armeniacum]|uniref:hypothetical protein n=1 Tax=Limibacter armeniacum TaxID=466084 RepID=UPI002FE5139F
MTKPQIPKPNKVHTGFKLELPLKMYVEEASSVYGKESLTGYIKYLIKKDLVKNKDKPFAQEFFKEAQEFGLLGFDVFDPEESEEMDVIISSPPRDRVYSGF